MAETVNLQISEALYQRLAIAAGATRAIAIKLRFLQSSVKLAMPPLTHPD